MSLPTAQELDERAARALKEAVSTLQRAFAEGRGRTGDFRQTFEIYKELQQTLDTEEAVEAARTIRERMAGGEGGGSPTGGGKHVCCMVDGSMNSFSALRWAVEHVVDPQDDIYLTTVVPYQEFESDAEKVLLEAYNFAHNAGVKPARLHPRTLAASGGGGSTRGVGESVRQFVEQGGVDLLVMGSRGMGSIKRSLLGSLGMGSVSDYCVQHLHCPILVIKEGVVEQQQQQLRRQQRQEE